MLQFTWTAMDIFKLNNMKQGWYVGNFEPSAFKTKLFEACYRIHPKGEVWDTHYHAHATEINLLIKGKMMIQNKILESGDVFILNPYEIADPQFLEDCEVVCIKTPCVIGDKIAMNSFDKKTKMENK